MIPPESHSITAELLEAYRATDYRVHTAPAMTLRVGERHEGLQELMVEQAVTSAAFVTASNPFSLALTEAVNTERQLELQRRLNELGLNWIEGLGQHPSGQWPGEVSCLIFNIALDQSIELAHHWGQNAFIWIDGSAIPELKLLR